MALRLTHWIALALAGCAAVALRLIPPSSMDFPRVASPQDVVYERALRQDVRLTNARLQRIRMAADLIPATLAHEKPLAFSAPADADPQEVGAALAQALTEASESLRGGADVALGLAYVDIRDYAYPGTSAALVSDAEYYFGERDGRAYCVAALPVWRMGRDGVVRLPGWTGPWARLGVCQAVARYGLPGAAVRRWLGGGGATMASTLTPSTPDASTFSTPFGANFERRLAFGLPVPGRARGVRTLTQEQCLAGVEKGCARLFLEPSDPSRFRFDYPLFAERRLLGATPLSATLESTTFEPADRHVLADLEAEFGPERVRRWWSADGDPAAAFRDAFGVEVGAWYAARTARLVKVSSPGPAVATHGLLGALALLVLGSLAGSFWARRRTVA